MKKVFFLILFPIISFSQELGIDDAFYSDDNGLLRSTNLFMDYVYSTEEIPKHFENTIEKSIESYKKVFDTASVISFKLITYYEEFLFLSHLNDRNSFEYSKKFYKLIDKEDKTKYRRFPLNLINDLVKGYLGTNNPEVALNILRDNKEVLLDHRKFTCGNGSSMHYNKVGVLFFEAYKANSNIDEALEYGFKYLLNNKKYSKEIVTLLSNKYSKAELISVYNNLEKSFVSKAKLTHSYFQFLNYTIGTDGYIGIYNYQNSKKSAFEQLKDIYFYNELSKFLGFR